TRAVKSVASRAAGPTTRRGALNASVVAYSTMSREGRSVRLQTIARPPSTSPAVAPIAVDGRAASDVRIAGAWPNRAGAAALHSAAPAVRRNVRRSKEFIEPRRTNLVEP